MKTGKGSSLQQYNSQHIDDTQYYAEDILCNKVNNTCFSIEDDESTDFTFKCLITFEDL